MCWSMAGKAPTPTPSTSTGTASTAAFSCPCSAMPMARCWSAAKSRGRRGRATWVRYFDHRFPTSPDSPMRTPARGCIEFLEAQHYRLCHWRLAPDAINYRRFFDINDLAVIRVDRREVYERVHALVFELIGAGHGRWLAARSHRRPEGPGRLSAAPAGRCLRGRGSGPFYLLVEKILGPGETLRATGRSPAPPATSSPIW
jgi:hypothetical protein